MKYFGPVSGVVPNERNCEHGNQRGHCELCSANEEIESLTRERDNSSKWARAWKKKAICLRISAFANFDCWVLETDMKNKTIQENYELKAENKRLRELVEFKE